MDIDFGKIKQSLVEVVQVTMELSQLINLLVKIIQDSYWYRSSKTKKNDNHVLEDFKEDEEEKINEITENIVKQLPTLIEKNRSLSVRLIRSQWGLNVE